MPIRRGGVNFARFRVSGSMPKDAKRWLQNALRKKAFEPIDVKSDEERAVGFVELEAPEQTGFEAGALFHGMHALFAWRVDKLKVSSGQVRTQLSQWAQAFENKNGRPPGRREKAEQKDSIRKALRSRQEPNTKVHEVSLDLAGKDLFVWSTSRPVVEEVQAVLEDALDVKLLPRVPAAFVDEAKLDALSPTPALFGEVG
ncbi:MAG: recombination-associated protein RdgC [Myxococcota bacterium]|jgi:DNA recombination-dependent growth factor C